MDPIIVGMQPNDLCFPLYSEMTTKKGHATISKGKKGSHLATSCPLPFRLHLTFFSLFTAFPLPLQNKVQLWVMGRAGARLPSFCLSHVATRARVRSPTFESKPIPETSDAGDAAKKEAVAVGRRIMVAVDSSKEAKSSLQWALSHAVQSSDTLVLLNVSKPWKHGRDKGHRVRDPKGYELLHGMKSICQSKMPEVLVELCLVEGKVRGPTIVEEARKQGVSLLILGQKKRFITWRLLMMWAGGGNNSVASAAVGVVEYCVQNSPCLTLAVRRKSRRGGGYLITTRRHRDFWLLA